MDRTSDVWDGAGDTVTRYVLLLFIINDRLCVYGGICYARVRTPTVTIFYLGRDGDGLYFLLLRMCFLRRASILISAAARLIKFGSFIHYYRHCIIVLSSPRVFEIPKMLLISRIH